MQGLYASPANTTRTRTLVAPASQGSQFQGAVLDVRGFKWGHIAFKTGVLPGTVDVVLQEADEDPASPGTPGTFADLPAAFQPRQLVSGDATDQFLIELDMQIRKRFLRLDVTPAGGAAFVSAKLHERSTRDSGMWVPDPASTFVLLAPVASSNG